MLEPQGTLFLVLLLLAFGQVPLGGKAGGTPVDVNDFAHSKQLHVPLAVVPGGGHEANVWRAALTPMLDWMTPQLAKQVANAEWRAQQIKLHEAHKPVKHHVVVKKPTPLT